MAESTDTPGEAQTSSVPAAQNSGNGGRAKSRLPQFAIDAADHQVARLSSALGEAADAIDGLIADNGATLPAPIADLMRTASGKLRGVADTAGQQDAQVLLGKAQQLARRNPAATIGIGAALGAALGLIITRLGSTAPARAA